MKTYSARPAEIEKKWILIDASGVVVGRLAALIATRLQGKHSPQYTPHIDTGDNIIVINAEKVRFTGKKREQHIYWRHTGFPGGIKGVTADKILDGEHPERVIVKAVERMMTRSPMGRQRMSNLRVYGGSEHPHTAQNPELFDVAALNTKNIRSRA